MQRVTQKGTTAGKEVVQVSGLNELIQQGAFGAAVAARLKLIAPHCYAWF